MSYIICVCKLCLGVLQSFYGEAILKGQGVINKYALSIFENQYARKTSWFSHERRLYIVTFTYKLHLILIKYKYTVSKWHPIRSNTSLNVFYPITYELTMKTSSLKYM